ncbi:hypothetical protein GUJ93_ZPchr0004g38150 [Zizania palustris]|uniref:BED-type domain-containing protein n=1 Tax=Zizania palustris TaxID=103762 RepID=A0A8J5SQN7_ZIZPA|nr:hypothetical protein GUJ93_ZPchr0004g38150 [Zizania palustris]
MSYSGANASSPVVPAEQYDPMVDPKRKAKSNDPRWKYGYWTEIGNRDKVTCNLCKTVTMRGITVMCSKTTTEIRKEMREYLENNKRNQAIFVDVDDEGASQGQEQSHQPSSCTVAKRRASFQWKYQATNTVTKQE